MSDLSDGARRLPSGEPAAVRGAPEPEDPLNNLLDAFEAQVQALIDNGLEPQLRARIQRLLPAPSDSASRSRPEGAEHPTSLQWSRLLTALRATRPRDGAEGVQVRQARAWVIQQMHAAQRMEKSAP